MPSTALIIRPKDAPEIHVLECDGPLYVVGTNRYPGSYSRSFLEFEEFTALPDHSKFPKDPPICEIEHNNIRRIYRLIDFAEYWDGRLSMNHLREIRARLKLIDKFCDEDF